MQVFDMEYTADKDPQSEVRLGWAANTRLLRQRFSSHFLGIKEVLDEAKRHHKVAIGKGSSACHRGPKRTATLS